MLIYKDGIVADYRKVFKDTSFPSTGISDQFLIENNAIKVSLFIPHDRATEKLVTCDPYVQGDFAYTVKVVPKTKEDLDAEKEVKSAEIRSQRDELLSKSDWRVIKAVEQGIQLDPKWAAYRQTLRDITNNPSFPDVELPEQP